MANQESPMVSEIAATSINMEMLRRGLTVRFPPAQIPVQGIITLIEVPVSTELLTDNVPP